DGAKVLMSGGPVVLAYQRPLSGAMTGVFSGQLYTLGDAQPTTLDFDSPLASALDQDLSKPDAKGHCELSARLYLVDGNGHVLSEVLDSAHKPIPFRATVTLGGKDFAAAEVHVTHKKPSKIVQNR